jgi:hypothetical protein
MARKRMGEWRYTPNILDGDEQSASHFVRLDSWLDGPQYRSRCCGEKTNLAPAGNRTPVVRPVNYRYTDWAIPDMCRGDMFSCCVTISIWRTFLRQRTICIAENPRILRTVDRWRHTFLLLISSYSSSPLKWLCTSHFGVIYDSIHLFLCLPTSRLPYNLHIIADLSSQEANKFRQTRSVLNSRHHTRNIKKGGTR